MEGHETPRHENPVPLPELGELKRPVSMEDAELLSRVSGRDVADIDEAFCYQLNQITDRVRGESPPKQHIFELLGWSQQDHPFHSVYEFARNHPAYQRKGSMVHKELIGTLRLLQTAAGGRVEDALTRHPRLAVTRLPVLHERMQGILGNGHALSGCLLEGDVYALLEDKSYDYYQRMADSDPGTAQSLLEIPEGIELPPGSEIMAPFDIERDLPLLRILTARTSDAAHAELGTIDQTWVKELNNHLRQGSSRRALADKRGAELRQHRAEFYTMLGWDRPSSPFHVVYQEMIKLTTFGRGGEPNFPDDTVASCRMLFAYLGEKIIAYLNARPVMTKKPDLLYARFAGYTAQGGNVRRRLQEGFIFFESSQAYDAQLTKEGLDPIAAHRQGQALFCGEDEVTPSVVEGLYAQEAVDFSSDPLGYMAGLLGIESDVLKDNIGKDYNSLTPTQQQIFFEEIQALTEESLEWPAERTLRALGRLLVTIGQQE